MNQTNAAFKRYAKQMDEMRIDPDFAFATGRVKVLEERLLSYAKLTEMARPDYSLDHFDAALSDASYPPAETPGERISLGAAENDALLKELDKGGTLAEGLLLQSDMHNLKVMLKYLKEASNKGRELSQLSETEKADSGNLVLPKIVADLVFFEGMTEPQALWEGLRKDLAGGPETSRSNDSLLSIAKEDMKHWPTDYRPAAMDMRIDQAWFAQLGKLIESAGKSNTAKYLSMYREMLADNFNLQTAARLLRMHGTVNTFQDAFVEGGQVQWQEAEKALLKGVKGLKDAYQDTAADALLPLLDDYVKGKNIYAFGQRIAETRLAFARFGLAAGNGVPQVAGFWLARRLEAQNLRIILAGKTNRNEEKRSLSLMRDTYRRGRT